MQIDDLVLTEYEKRTKNLQETIEEKEKRLSFLTNREKNKFSYHYFVERNFDGVKVSLHRKGNEIKVFSDNKNVSEKFLSCLNDVGRLASADFVLDAICVLTSRDPIFYVFDCPFFGRSLENFPLFERKKVIKSLNYSDRIKESGCVEVSSKSDAEEAIELFNRLDDSRGAFLKSFNSKYFYGKGDWVEFLSSGRDGKVEGKNSSSKT